MPETPTKIVFSSNQQEPAIVAPYTVLIHRMQTNSPTGHEIIAYYLNAAQKFTRKLLTLDEERDLLRLMRNPSYFASESDEEVVYTGSPEHAEIFAHEVDVDIPQNPASLYYAILLGFLVPVLDQDKELRSRATKLFGPISHDEFYQLKTTFLRFNGCWASLALDQFELFIEKLRLNIFKHIQAKKGRYTDSLAEPWRTVKEARQEEEEYASLGVIDTFIPFEARKEAWAGTLEREAAEELLGIRFALFSRNELALSDRPAALEPLNDLSQTLRLLQIVRIKLQQAEADRASFGQHYCVSLRRSDITKIPRKVLRTDASEPPRPNPGIAFPEVGHADVSIADITHQNFVEKILAMVACPNPLLLKLAFETTRAGYTAFMEYLLTPNRGELPGVMDDIENALAKNEVEQKIIEYKQLLYKTYEQSMRAFQKRLQEKPNLTKDSIKRKMLIVAQLLKSYVKTHLEVRRRDLRCEIGQDPLRTVPHYINNRMGHYYYYEITAAYHRIFQEGLKVLCRDLVMPLMQVIEDPASHLEGVAVHHQRSSEFDASVETASLSPSILDAQGIVHFIQADRVEAGAGRMETVEPALAEIDPRFSEYADEKAVTGQAGTSEQEIVASIAAKFNDVADEECLEMVFGEERQYAPYPQIIMAVTALLDQGAEVLRGLQVEKQRLITEKDVLVRKYTQLTSHAESVDENIRAKFNGAVPEFFLQMHQFHRKTLLAPLLLDMRAQGKTLAHVAALNGHGEIFIQLICLKPELAVTPDQDGPDGVLPLKAQDPVTGDTLLHKMIAAGKFAEVEALLKDARLSEYAYDLNLRNKAGYPALRQLVPLDPPPATPARARSPASAASPVQQTDPIKCTPLGHACRTQNLERFRFWLSKGADPFMFSADGNTAVQDILKLPKELAPQFFEALCDDLDQRALTELYPSKLLVDIEREMRREWQGGNFSRGAFDADFQPSTHLEKIKNILLDYAKTKLLERLKQGYNDPEVSVLVHGGEESRKRFNNRYELLVQVFVILRYTVQQLDPGSLGECAKLS